MDAPTQQLNAIHAMLAAGHRNLRIERHTLFLWGVPAGLLWAISEHILTPAQLPDNSQRALAWLGLLLLTLSLIAIVDWHWTRRAKATRDEAWSFIHRQVIKVWWLTMGLAALTTFAMFFYGGAYMLCTVWLVCLGIGLYVHGLFSEELLEWVGLLCIVVGIAGLLARLPYETMRWIAAAVFGIGLPLVAMMLDRGRHRPAWIRLMQMLGWLAAVLILPLWIESRAHQGGIPEQPAIPLAEYLDRPGMTEGRHIVTLPPGTAVPVALTVGGDFFSNGGEKPGFTLMTAMAIDVLVRDGELTGDIRLPGRDWQQSRNVRLLSIPWLKAELIPGVGPRVSGSLILQIGND